MWFDLKTAERIARRYLWPTVVVILVFSAAFSAAFLYVWQWERDLNDREQQLNHDLNERERLLNSREVDQEKRELTIAEQENLVKQRETNLAEQAAANARSKADGSKVLLLLRAQEAKLSEAAQIAKTDDQIHQLIREFAATGVDLKNPPPCSDTAAVSRFDHATAIRDAISGLASTNDKLSVKYGSFIGATHRALNPEDDCVSKLQ